MKLVNIYSGNVVKAVQWRAKSEDSNEKKLGNMYLVGKVFRIDREATKQMFGLEGNMLKVYHGVNRTVAHDTDFILLDHENNILVMTLEEMRDNYTFYGR